MHTKTPLEELRGVLEKYQASVLYTPLTDEVNYSDPQFPLPIPSSKIVVPDSKNSDPYQWADQCVEKYKDSDVVYILVPGTKFDVYGARRGKGGGWYDRSLSKIPASWLKIGVCDRSQVSLSPIEQQPWDKSVDWLLISSGDNIWSAYDTQTHRMIRA